MELYKNKYRIKSTRLRCWNYSKNRYYFVTICTKNKKYFFGIIKNDKMYLSRLGKTVKQEWEKTESLRKDVFLDHYVIMPNHLHGIIVIEKNEKNNSNSSLGSIISNFKASVTKKFRLLNSFQPIWQPRFYDRIIRNDKELEKIRYYIEYNPLKWALDKYNIFP